MIKMLVSTKETQRQRTSDFCFVQEGELLRFTFECDRDREDIDGKCGCKRCMSGIENKKSTTTFKVVEVNYTFDELYSMYWKSNQESGFNTSYDEIKEEVNEINRIASFFNINDIIEKRGEKFCKRNKVMS